MEDTLFVYIWQDRNPNEKVYTYFRRKPYFIGSRLDYVLVDTKITSWIKMITILPSYRSDHLLLFIEIVPHSIKKGRGLWKMNTQVLFEKEYLAKINDIIKQSEIYATQLEAPERWEILKSHAIAKTQIYCNHRASNRKLILS